jgi:hypothetical protein
MAEVNRPQFPVVLPDSVGGMGCYLGSWEGGEDRTPISDAGLAVNSSRDDLDNPWIYFRYIAKADTPNRKPAVSILLRVTPERADLIQRALDHAGISRSDWIRERLIRAARMEMGEEQSPAAGVGPTAGGVSDHLDAVDHSSVSCRRRRMSRS